MQSEDLLDQPRQTQEAFFFNTLNNVEVYFKHKLYHHMNSDVYNKYTLIREDDEDRVKFSKIFQQMQSKGSFDSEKLELTQQESRGVASLLGLAICDALGASTQFMPFDKERNHLIKEGFKDITNLIKARVLDTRHGAVGIWTDDCSMALAMAYSLLLKDYNFDPVHFRYMFILWLHHGLGNGGRKFSIGLGGNISISMNEFTKEQVAYCQTGEQFNNGNGSLMRLAPVPLAFSDNLEEAIKFSGNQSLTTHNGLQAKQCSKLLASILIGLIHRPEGSQWKIVIEKICNDFKTDLISVQYLARSQQESQEMFDENKKSQRTFKKFNKTVADRNWNWKSKDYSYSPCRLKQQPGYIGSYCMDALSMALHTVWHTKSFKECAIFNANIGGDCDTVGAIAGQIAGAVYGVDSDMLKLYSQMVDFTSKRYEVFLVGLKLINKKKIDTSQFSKPSTESSEKQQENQQKKQQEKQQDKLQMQNDNLLSSQMQDQSQEPQLKEKLQKDQKCQKDQKEQKIQQLDC